MTIVDYGYEPGRYILPFAQIVGKKDKDMLTLIVNIKRAYHNYL